MPSRGRGRLPCRVVHGRDGRDPSPRSRARAGTSLGGVVSYANEARRDLARGAGGDPRGARRGERPGRPRDGRGRPATARGRHRGVGHRHRRARRGSRREAGRADLCRRGRWRGRRRPADRLGRGTGPRTGATSARRRSCELLLEPSRRSRGRPRPDATAGRHRRRARPGAGRPARSRPASGSTSSARPVPGRARRCSTPRGPGARDGCDPGGPSPYTAAIEAAGIASPGRMRGARTRPGARRLAVTKALTAIDPDHPELVAARAGRHPDRAVAAGDRGCGASGRPLIGVAGTHGKSTTAGWLVHVLGAAGPTLGVRRRPAAAALTGGTAGHGPAGRGAGIRRRGGRVRRQLRRVPTRARDPDQGRMGSPRRLRRHRPPSARRSCLAPLAGHAAAMLVANVADPGRRRDPLATGARSPDRDRDGAA